MASASFQVQRGAYIDVLATGTQAVIEGTAAPTTANAIELRVDLAANWTKEEVKTATDTIVRFLTDVTQSTSIPL